MKDYIIVVPLVSRDYEEPFVGYSGGETPDNDGSHVGFHRGAYFFYKRVSGTEEEALKEYEDGCSKAEARLYASRLMKTYRVILHNVTDDVIIESDCTELFDGVPCCNKNIQKYL